MRARSHFWPGALLLAGATLLLHAPGISWGLPSAYGWAPDELLPETILDVLAHGFSGGWTSKYPPFHQMLLGVLGLPVLWKHGLDAADPVPGDVYHTLFLIGRGLSLLMAAGVVVLVYDCGRRLLDRRGALFAALLTATLLPFGFYAKLANLDVPYLFWALVSLRFLLRAAERPRRRELVGFAVTAVLSVATKDQAYGLYALAPPLLALAYVRARRGASAFSRGDLLATALAAVVTFVLAFNLICDWPGFVAHARLITGPASEDFQLFPNTLAGQAALARQTAVNLSFVLGLPALAVCLLGVGSVIARRLTGGPAPLSLERGRPNDRLLALLLIPALSYYATFLAVVLYSYDRFLLPIAVLLTFFGGRVLSEATAWPGWQGRLGRVVALVVVGYGVARCVSLDALMRHDARYAAERFLGERVGRDERVAGIGALPHLPRLDGLRWTTLPPSINTLAGTRPEWLVINADLARRAPEGSGKARFYERLRRGELGYQQAYADRWRARFLFFDPERLQAGAYGPVLSNLERVNPEIQVFALRPQ